MSECIPPSEYEVLVLLHSQLERGAALTLTAEFRAQLEDILQHSIGDTPASVLRALRSTEPGKCLVLEDRLRAAFRAEVASALLQFPAGRTLLRATTATLSCITRMTDAALCKVVSLQLRQGTAFFLPHTEVVQFAEIILQSYEADKNNVTLQGVLECLKAMTGERRKGETLFRVDLGALAPCVQAELQMAADAASEAA